MTEHQIQHKKSIRFFSEPEVRAIWGNKHNKWWFSVLDIIAGINEQDNYQRPRNHGSILTQS